METCVQLVRDAESSSSSSNPINKLEKAFDIILRCIDKVEEAVQKIKGNSDINIKLALRECDLLLHKVLQNADAFLERADSMYKFAILTTKEEEDITKAIESGDTKDYNAYLEQIVNYLDQIETLYKDFKEINATAREKCTAGLKASNTQLEDLKAQGNSQGGEKAFKIGAAVAVGGVLGLATVVGFFTWGIGTPVVLGIAGTTASGTAIGGGIVSYTGKVIKDDAEKYKKSSEFETKSEFLDEMLKYFDEFNTKAGTAYLSTREAKITINAMQANYENVKKSETSDSTTTFVKQFKMLVENFRDTHHKIKTCQKKIKELDKK